MKDKKPNREEFLNAVDIVCLNCHYLSEETCDPCPVRKTVEEITAMKG